MKQDIINLLRTNPGLTTNDIVNGSDHKKRGSVSKCLSRLVASGEIVAKHRLHKKNVIEYSLPLQPAGSPSPANSEVPATTNA